MPKTINTIRLSAAMAVSLLALSALPAQAAEQIGVAAAVRGDVKLIPPGETGRKAVSGGDVNFMETVKSGEESGLQVLLLDETTFTVGPQSEIIIDEMVYDPAGNSKLSVTVAQGAFRYLSGEIAKQNPEQVTIKTPMGNIGIRGTNLFAVETGGQWFFGLLGPGPQNNTGDKPGGFVFRNAQGAAEVRRAGFGFSVEPGQAPSAVGPIPKEVFAKFTSAMSEQGAENGQDNGQDGDQNGNGQAQNGQQQDGQQAADNGQQAGGQQDGDQAQPAPQPGSFASAADESGQTGATTLVKIAVQESTLMVTQTIADTTTSAGQTTSQLLAATGTAYELIPLRYDEVKAYSGSAKYTDLNVPMYTGSLPCPAPCQGGVTAEELRQAFNWVQDKKANSTAVGVYDFVMTADFSKRTLTGGYNNISIPSHSVTGANMNFTLHYNTKTGVFDETVQQTNVVAGKNLDAGFVFLKSTGTKPHLAQALMLTDSNWNDLVAGASIIAPK